MEGLRVEERLTWNQEGKLPPVWTAHILQTLEKQFPHVLAALYRHKSAVLAGGFIRDLCAGLWPKDVDLWFPTGMAASLLLDEWRSVGAEVEIRADKLVANVKFGDRHGHQPNLVQVIWAVRYAFAPALIGTFDFTMTQAALWTVDGKIQSTCTPAFIEDVQDRVLRFARPGLGPWKLGGHKGSLRRSYEFVARGWKPDFDSIGEMYARAVGRMVGDPTMYRPWREMFEVDEDYNPGGTGNLVI